MKTVLFLLPLLLLMNCVNLEVINTSVEGSEIEKNIESVKPEDVVIYRTMKPDDMQNYKESGVIVLRGDNPDITEIFKLFREEAGKRGVVYIVDFGLKCNLETRTRTVSSYTAKGGYSSRTETYTVTAYSATGTLLRRKK